MLVKTQESYSVFQEYIIRGKKMKKIIIITFLMSVFMLSSVFALDISYEQDTPSFWELITGNFITATVSGETSGEVDILFF